MKRRLLRILSITSLVAILLFTMAGIALAVDYYLYVKVSSESGTSDYAPLALAPNVNNQSLADLGYISESGLDTRVTYAGSELKHMVAEDKLAFVAPEVKGGVDYSYNYTMGNDPLTEFSIIPGYDGYITVNDAAALEPGDNFEIELDGYVDTDAGSNKNLVYKQDACKIYISGATDITGGIYLTTESVYEIVRPNGVGYVTDIPGLEDTTHWGACSDQSDSTYVYEDTATWYTDLYEVQDSSGEDAIIKVVFWIRGMEAGGNAQAKHCIRTYNTNYSSDTIAFSTSYADYSWEHTTNPNTGSAWTWSEIDSLQAGLELYRGAAAAGRCSEVWVEVYTYPLLTVTATGVSSGEHKVKVTADGTDLKIYIDDVEEDSVALAGASVPDNTNNWTLIQNNVAPYLDFYKHTVSSTLIAWYQPNDMISGTTLPDREGTAQNGTFTWGSPPTGISIDTGSLKIVNLQNISKEAEEGAYLELFEEAPPEWEGMYEGEEYNVLPGSEAISELAAAGQIPIKLFWVPVIFGIAIFAGLFIYGKTRNIMAVAIAGGIVIGLFCAIGMLVWWVIIPYSIMAVALCVSEKTYGF